MGQIRRPLRRERLQALWIPLSSSRRDERVRLSIEECLLHIKLEKGYVVEMPVN